VPPVSSHFRLEQVAGRTWAAIAAEGGGAVANAGVVDLGGRSLVFDTFLTPRAASDLRAAAEELAGPVAWVVNSHAHSDHWGGNQAFAGVPIAASQRTPELIEETGPGRLEELREAGPAYIRELDGKLAAGRTSTRAPSSRRSSLRPAS